MKEREREREKEEERMSEGKRERKGNDAKPTQCTTSTCVTLQYYDRLSC